MIAHVTFNQMAVKIAAGIACSGAATLPCHAQVSFNGGPVVIPGPVRWERESRTRPKSPYQA